MRISILLICSLAMGACTSTSDDIKRQTADRSTVIEEDCGRRPISLLRGSRSPGEVLYAACRRHSLDALRAQENAADAD